MTKLSITKTKKIIFTALLLAVFILLERPLSIRTISNKISFGFIPLIIAAIYLGPKYSTLIGALGDLIGAFLMPSGIYFPGFTITGGVIRVNLWNILIPKSK